MSMTTQEIMEILPHRASVFAHSSTVEEVEPGVRAVAKKNVTFSMEPFFAVGFSGKSGLPGVPIVEALAQTLVRLRFFSQPEWKGKTADLAGINKAKFKQKVVAGILWCLETEIIKVKGPIGVGRQQQK